MEHTGIIRRIDDLGRIVIPKEIIRIMGFQIDQPLEIFPDPENGTVTFKRCRVGTRTLKQSAIDMKRLVRESAYSLCSHQIILNKLAEIDDILKNEDEFDMGDNTNV